MNTPLALLLELADREFDGASFNGPPLMKTLESLTPEMAAYSDTYEGYSAWEVALHVAYYKHFILTALEPGTAPYPLPKGPSGFGAPLDRSSEAWKGVLAYLREVHGAVMKACRAMDSARLGEIMPRWKVPYVEGISWLCTHDLYHCAQLRNMAVPGLKEAKES